MQCNLLAQSRCLTTGNKPLRWSVALDRVKWAICLFQPYKSTGGCHHYHSVRVNLVLGYIPNSWRCVKVVFIPQLNISNDSFKAFRPIILTSFLLKTEERLRNRHNRENALVTLLLHYLQHAYQIGKSIETAPYCLVLSIEKAFYQKELPIGLFLDIQGASI